MSRFAFLVYHVEYRLSRGHYVNNYKVFLCNFLYFCIFVVVYYYLYDSRTVVWDDGFTAYSGEKEKERQ